MKKTAPFAELVEAKEGGGAFRTVYDGGRWCAPTSQTVTLIICFVMVGAAAPHHFDGTGKMVLARPLYAS